MTFNRIINSNTIDYVVYICFVHKLLANISVQVNSNIYLKNPDSSELGRRIVGGGVVLMEDIGFEQFTFRKLAQHISSTEASIYRYFDSKHKFLVYLTEWYWGLKEVRIVIGLANIPSAEERLVKAVRLLHQDLQIGEGYDHIDGAKLSSIIRTESSKSYLTKEVDLENKEGLFSTYKSITDRISAVVSEINAAYKYPNMIVSTMIEGLHHQQFFSDHLPALTNRIKGEDAILDFHIDMMIKTIKG